MLCNEESGRGPAGTPCGQARARQGSGGRASGRSVRQEARAQAPCLRDAGGQSIGPSTTILTLEYRLLDGNRLSKIARLVHVASATHGYMVGQQLKRYRC